MSMRRYSTLPQQQHQETRLTLYSEGYLVLWQAPQQDTYPVQTMRYVKRSTPIVLGASKGRESDFRGSVKTWLT